MAAAALDIKDVTKSYGTKTVLKGITFHADAGEFIVLVGPSGCGKSTMLRSIAGLESVSTGAVLIGDRDVTSLEPKDRDIAMVFQDYALYPHKSVYENIAFGLRMRKLSEREIDTKVQQAAQRLDLGSLLERRPAALSGGQRQRVAIGRAIVRDPKVFLFDEPLSNLDAKLRGSMRLTIAKLHKELGTTVVYVTHDQIEAMTLADRIVVLDGGKIQQVGKPLDLYYHPNNIFVATFIGTPSMNLIPGVLDGRADGLWFKSDGGMEFAISKAFVDQIKKAEATVGAKSGSRVLWGIRPENMRVNDGVDGGNKANIYDARVVVSEPTGPQTSVYCDVHGHEIHVTLPAPHRPMRGDMIRLQLHSRHFYLFDEATGRSLIED